MYVLVYGKYECLVMQMYGCVLCASCGSSQCCIMHALQFVNAGRGCKRRPYGSSRSLQLLCILPFGMVCLSAISVMFDIW